MILDANVCVGRSAAGSGRCFADSGVVLDALDRFGMQRALVYHALARESDAARGNRLLHELIEGHPRLLPSWVVIPSREAPEALMRDLDAHHVRAVRCFPRAGHFSVRPWCIGPLADALSRSGRTLIVDFESLSWSNDATDWEGLDQLCRAFPSLPVLVSGVTVAGPANYSALMERLPNLYLDIGKIGCPGEVRRLVDGGAGDRLIYGSDLPIRHAGAPLNMLAAETLADAARTAILGGNLSRLLGLDRGSGAASAQACPPGNGAIIDTHLHLGGWNNASSGSGAAADIVHEMDRCGVARAIATSLWACFGEVRLGNADVAAACRAFPGRLYGYLTLDPKHPDEVAEELARHGDDSRFVGIKLHAGTHAVGIADARCRPILEYADRREWPVLVHEGFNADMWRGVCTSYPRARFIVAHVGGMGGVNREMALALAGVCRDVRNLYVDLASSASFYGFLEQLIEVAGADRILFGSDHPLFDFGYELGQVLYADISEADRQAILGGNAARLFCLFHRLTSSNAPTAPCRDSPGTSSGSCRTRT